MRVGDVLYFSPKWRFMDMDLSKKDMVLDAFRDRLDGFYLNPAHKLAEGRNAFACGVLCSCAVDFLSQYDSRVRKVGARIEAWLIANVDGMSRADTVDATRTLAQRFYSDFRCGLVHEGRIKNLGEFSFDYDKVIVTHKKLMIVNPKILLSKIRQGLGTYLHKVDAEPRMWNKLKRKLKAKFGVEIAESLK